MSEKFEDRIQRLRQLRTAKPDSEAIAMLRKGFEDRANLVVAEAAKTVVALRFIALIPELLNAFDRLLQDPVKADPKCWGKIAIVKTLTELEYDQSPVFLKGSKHVQMEPVWGGQEDSAAQLRGASILALVQCTDLRRVQIMKHLVDGLNDPEDPVRAEAVRALAQMAGDEAILLLRLKARIGDRRPRIIGEVFDGLIAIEEAQGVMFVADYLKSASDEIRDEAALSLGASRRSEAIRILTETWKERRSAAFRDVLLRALSSSRDPVAVDFLLDLIREGNDVDSATALQAFALHTSDELQIRIENAKAERAKHR